MPPLLQRLSERHPESLEYLGVSYGLTPQLLRYVIQYFNQSRIDHRMADSGNELVISHCISVKHLVN